MPRKRNVDPGVYSYKVGTAERWGAVVYADLDPVTGRRMQKRKQGFLKKKDALDWRISQLARRGKTPHAMIASRQPVRDYLVDWVESLTDLTPNTRINCRNALAPARDELGSIALSALTPSMIETFNADRIRRGDKRTAVYNTFRILKRALRRAYILGLIAENPCDRVKTPRTTKHEATTWTHAHMTAFLATNRNHPIWGDLWCFMCETWVRAGEVAALRWSDIDLHTGRVSIERSITRTDDLQFVESTPKTDNSRRVIAISPQLVAVLIARKERRADTENALVFPNANGSYMKSQSIASALQRACLLAGVPELRPHELRHNGGSIAYMDGVDIKAISERMGHANISITLEIYTHLNDSHHKGVAERIGTLIWEGL